CPAAPHALAAATAAAPSAPEAAPPPSTEPTGPDEVDWSTVEVTLTEAQTRQFVTYYEALQDFDDRAAHAQVPCPRLCLVGAADEISYDERWGGVRVSMADPVIGRRAELESLGWRGGGLEGLDHPQAKQNRKLLP